MPQTHRPRVPRKRLVSIRLDVQDVERVRRIANRLQARESDVFRFALSLAFSRLSLLCEGHVGGTDLLPLLLDHGPELIRHFNLDVPRLMEIINAEPNGKLSIEASDVELLAMRSVPDSYVNTRMRALIGDAGHQDAAARLRTYFYRKYFAEAPEPARRAEELGAAR